MESKFNIGNEIHFMNDNKPQKKTIKGISFYQGEISELHFSKQKDTDHQVIYHYGNYSQVNEKDVFETENELKEFLFSNTK